MARQSKSRRRWTLHHYHRYLGLLAAFLVLVLSVTGILLNHTEYWRLDERRVSQQWLLSLYGIPEPKLKASYALENGWVMQWDESLYFNDANLSGLKGNVVGVTEYEGLVLVAVGRKLGLYSQDAELVDVIDAPDPIVRLGSDAAGFVYAKTIGELVALNGDLTEWAIADGSQKILWSAQTTLTAIEQRQFLKSFQGEGLPMERVVLDLHSGRIAGNLGVYVMDLAAIILIVLALTGFYTWGRRKWRQR